MDAQRLTKKTNVQDLDATKLNKNKNVREMDLTNLRKTKMLWKWDLERNTKTNMSKKWSLKGFKKRVCSGNGPWHIKEHEYVQEMVPNKLKYEYVQLIG